MVGDVKQAGLDEMASEAVYIPQRLAPPWSGGQTSMVIRTTVTPSSLAASARGVVRGLDAAVPVTTCAWRSAPRREALPG